VQVPLDSQTPWIVTKINSWVKTAANVGPTLGGTAGDQWRELRALMCLETEASSRLRARARVCVCVCVWLGCGCEVLRDVACVATGCSCTAHHWDGVMQYVPCVSLSHTQHVCVPASPARFLATPNFFVEKICNLRRIPTGMRYDPSLQVWRRVTEPGMGGVPPPLVFPGDKHLLAHAIESYARASYGGGAVASPVIVDATGSAARGAFRLGRNLAGSTDAAAAAVAQAVSQTTRLERWWWRWRWREPRWRRR